MSLNCLGALLNSLCEKCSTKLTCDCCTKKIIIVGQVESERDLGHVREIIQRTNRDLELLTSQIEYGLERLATRITHKEQAETEECKPLTVDLGILKITERYLDKLQAGESDLAERWARLSVACALCEVDLQTKMQNYKALTKHELKALDKKVELVCKYGSHAVVLWKLVRAYEGNLELLCGFRAISPKQAEILNKHLVTPPVGIFERNRFADLELPTKEAFLNAAVVFSREYLKHNESRYEAFTKEDKENDASSLPDLNRSYLSSPAQQAPRILNPLERELSLREKIELFFRSLGQVDLTQDQLDQNLRSSLGILRAQVLGIQCGIDDRRIVEGNLTEKEFEQLSNQANSLHEIDGALCFLFRVLKQSIEEKELLQKPYITEPLIAALKSQIKRNPDFLYMLKRASELAGLKPPYIQIIATLTDFIPPEAKAELNKEFPVIKWLAEKRDKTPSLNGRGSPAISEPPAVELNLDDEKTP